MYTKQRLSVLLIGAALACSAGAQQALPYRADAMAAAATPGAVTYDQTTSNQADPPARVARLSNLTGAVSFTPAGENDWVQAQLNRPVVTGDKLWTDASARAELQVGSSTVELDHDSSFDFLNLDDRLAQMELTQGALSLDVRRIRGEETYEVDTPTIAFVADRVGDYRIDVDPQGTYTVVTARRGGGDAVGEGGKRVRIEEGQSVRFNDSQLNDYQVNQIAAPDEFDQYASQRVERYAAAPRDYVSEDVTGYEDLDSYGTWEEAPEYGHVWYPSSVAVDWAPYHDGRWTWVDPWGWTWVDDAPWGFAPFHYGRWAYIGSRWGWVPGPVDIEPVYAPALVAFVGGGGFGIDISFGGPIGWFALGPGDVYFPGYRCGRDYFTRVNIGNAVINRGVVNNYYGNWSRGSLNYSRINYANRTTPGALAAMSGRAFVAGTSVRSSAVAVNRTMFANARIMPRAALAPTRESLVAGRGRASPPPSATFGRNVVAAHQPAGAAPSFAQRQAILRQNGAQPLTTTQMRALAVSPGGNARRTGNGNNVRVVGNRGPEIAARAAAGPRNARASAMTGNARSTGTSPSRAAEMNRSPAKANAQYLRSAGFAHQGVIPGSERSTTADAARARAAARATTRESARTDNRAARFSGVDRGSGNERATMPARGRLNSSTFAHTRNGDAATATMRSNAIERRSATARSESSQRVRTPRAESHVVAQRPNPGVESRARSGAFAAQGTRGIGQRPSTPQFSRSSNVAAHGYRPTEQRATVQRSTPQYRAAPSRVESARENRPAFTQRSAPVHRPEPMQRSAPVQRSEPPMRAQQQVTRAPPQQRAPSQPRQMARSAPREPRAKSGSDRKHDNNGGG